MSKIYYNGEYYFHPLALMEVACKTMFYDKSNTYLRYKKRTMKYFKTKFIDVLIPNVYSPSHITLKTLLNNNESKNEDVTYNGLYNSPDQLIKFGMWEHLGQILCIFTLHDKKILENRNFNHFISK